MPKSITHFKTAPMRATITSAPWAGIHPYMDIAFSEIRAPTPYFNDAKAFSVRTIIPINEPEPCEAAKVIAGPSLNFHCKNERTQ